MSGTRTIAAHHLPTAGVWTLDPGHAEVGFVGRHFGLTKVRGRFTDVEAAVTIGDDPEQSYVEVTIQMASVSSGDQRRDDHLRSDDLFDVARYPTAAFRSTSVTVDGNAGTMDGELTIKEVTRPVRLAIEFLGSVDDPWGNQRAVFSAAGRVNREDWGLTWNVLLDAGGLLVSKEIELAIEVELVRQNS